MSYTRLALTGDVVMIEVGVQHTKYRIHRAFLVHYSEYFAKALQEPSVEAETGLIELHDIEPVVCKCHPVYSYARAE